LVSKPARTSSFLFGDKLAQARQSKISLASIWRKPDNQKIVWRASGASQAIKNKFGEYLAQARQSKISLASIWRKPGNQK
jgi:hypothetical protein